jgi:hypothetical protein
MNAPDMTVSQGLAQFAAIVERYRIDLVLVKRHYLRLAVGLGASLLVIAYNAFHAHATEDIHRRVIIAGWLILAHLLACFLVVAICGWRLRAGLRRRPATMRASVMQVVDFVHRWGNVMLLLAASGHAALVLGTLIGLDVFTREGRILLASLAPTLLLIIHGLTEIPTREKLLTIQASALAMRGASQ